MADRLASSLQQSVLSALCFDDTWGAVIAAQVQPDHFDAVFRDFAARILNYRRKHHRPPGVNHVEDLAIQTGAREDSLVLKRLVPTLLAEGPTVNAEYVAQRVNEFIRRQTYKRAIAEAGERYQQDDEKLLEDLDHIFHEVLTARQTVLDAGTFLTDSKALRFLDRSNVDFIPLGIKELDAKRIGLVPKTLLLYVAAKGSGKSWFAVHCGKQALLQRMSVAHVSLEMPTEEVMGRYFQALFGAATEKGSVDITALKFDKIITDKLVGLPSESVKPRINFEHPNIRNILKNKIGEWGLRLGRLVVKDFPTGSLTIDQLIGYLDYLELVEGFTPNLLIVDYPKLMKLDRRDPRISIGRNMEELRGIAAARGLALVCPHQGTRASIGARRVRSSMASEDISVIQTADLVLAYSQTEAEERKGLGRLSVEHSRTTRAGLTLLLTQSYETGQYVLDSYPLPKNYWDLLPDDAKREELSADDT